MTSQGWTAIHAKFHQTLRQRQLLPQGKPILIAVSGGQDSLCLAKLLLDLQPKWHWSLAIAHCDHRWASDEGMAAHVEQIAQNWQLPFYLKTASQAITETEAAARKWRYQVLEEIAKEQGFSVLVTGHTQSDRAETLLYNLIRGAGADGLSALTWVRPLSPLLQIVRPLLNITRTETFQFCQRFQLPIWEDLANQKLQFARNRVRANVIPYLQTHFNPQVEIHLAQTAELLRAETEYLEQVAHTLFAQIITANQLGLNRLKLRSVPLALQRRVIKHFLSELLPKYPNFVQIESVVALINASNRERTSSFPGGGWLEVQDDLIVYCTLSK